MNKALGTHVLVELYGCNSDKINDPQLIEKEMLRAAELIGARVISSNAHHFKPHGVSAVVVIAESHLTLHTWPEHGYAAVDLFICTGTTTPHAATEHLKTVFEASQSSTIELKRGQLSDMTSN